MLFISRLIADGYNVLSDRRLKMMESVKDKLADTINERLKERMDFLKNPGTL